MYQFLTKDKNYIEVLGWIEENKIDVTKESLNNFDIELLAEKSKIFNGTTVNFGQFFLQTVSMKPSDK